MEIISRALVLLALFAVLLVVQTDSAPARPAEDDSVQYSRQELVQLFQEDAKWASSSSNSRGRSSEELKQNLRTVMKALNIQPVPRTTVNPLLYVPMPHQPIYDVDGNRLN
ncbi:hypothetical protein quinque_010952 [Culex quinquefasciatus]|uniref:uncharacterized protein LOC6031875 n=1 Tax=Culex quinquefasciatus TaxID=7176 RepID=UPI0018E2BAE7|nr:uncharacterized protein LOC6031875 [Culex quinquefasciatus]XP_039448675.1 uncharacterized protein LOC120427817 [Culex pipiens pallens]